MIAIIVAHERDTPILELCIGGIQNNCKDISRIIVISKTQLTNSAEWLNEDTFPFSYEDVAKIIGNTGRVGWYFQQLLKLYALQVLNQDTGLVVDADTVFMRPVSFTKNGKLLFNVGSEHHIPYFEHIRSLIPGLEKQTNYSGICHHIVFSKLVLERIFLQVEEIHKQPFWKSMLKYVHPTHYEKSGMSEYELYFNWVLKYEPHTYNIRQLSWKNAGSYNKQDSLLFDYVSIHWYIRK